MTFFFLHIVFIDAEILLLPVIKQRVIWLSNEFVAVAGGFSKVGLQLPSDKIRIYCTLMLLWMPFFSLSVFVSNVMPLHLFKLPLSMTRISVLWVYLRTLPVMHLMLWYYAANQPYHSNSFFSAYIELICTCSSWHQKIIQTYTW